MTTKLKLASTYIKLSQEKMMYLDGGDIPMWFAAGIVYITMALLSYGATVLAAKRFTSMHSKYLAKKYLNNNLEKLGLLGVGWTKCS